MAGNIYIGEIIENEEIQKDCFLMTIKLPLLFKDPLSGQFVMLRIAGLNEPFLSRPISIYSFSRRENHCAMALLYQVVGKGTQIMAGLIEGSQVEINGPLGNGFETESIKENIIFISGGIGIAPLSMLIENLQNRADCSLSTMILYQGFQSSSTVVGVDRMRGVRCDVNVCTDDGTLGEKGLVTSIFQRDLNKYTFENSSFYACGPKAMLKALAKILNKKRLSCQVSLEERMACGTGACLGCAVAVKDEEGKLSYKRVCADGPVFNLADIIWEDK